MDENFNKDTIKYVMSMVTEMAKNKEGSFFIITKKSIKSEYENLYPELFNGKMVSVRKPESRTLLLKLSELDGAIVIDNNGIVQTYGAKIKKTKVLFGHGTRHSAARGVSKTPGVMSIISSEEDGKIRIFEKGNLIAELDPETGKNTKFVDRFAALLSKSDIQVATSTGVASLIIGLNPIVAGMLFTGSYIITKFGIASLNDFVKTGKVVVKEPQEFEIKRKKPLFARKKKSD